MNYRTFNYRHLAAFCFWIAAIGMLLQGKTPQGLLFFSLAVLWYLLGNKRRV